MKCRIYAEDGRSRYWIEMEQQRLMLSVDENEGLVYHAAFRKNNDWVWAADIATPVIASPLFRLVPGAADIVTDQDKPAIRFHGSTRYITQGSQAESSYTWTLSVTAERIDWVRFELTCDFPEPGRMDGRAPELLLRLGALPPYDRGHAFWARTELAGYSRFDHTPNNDFPSCYYRDPFRQFEALLWFDMEAMDWMGEATMMRFRDYRLGLKEVGYGANASLAFGLYAASRSGDIWPQGSSRIAYAIRLRHEPRQTNDRQALVALIEACGAFIPAVPERVYGISWRQLAEGVMRDLANDTCWVRGATGSEWLRPYVDSYSPAWSAVAEWEGKPGNENVGDTPYMSWFQETVLAPLLVLSADASAHTCKDGSANMQTTAAATVTATHEAAAHIAQRMLASSMMHYRTIGSAFAEYLASNMTDETSAGTWQYLHAIRELWRIGDLTGNSEIKRKARAEFERRGLPLIEKHAFIPPTLHNPLTLEKVGPSVSFSVLGYVADMCMNMYRDEHNQHWLDLAHRSLTTLARAPEYAVHQESNQLALAVLAAAGWVEAKASGEGGKDALAAIADMTGHVRYLSHQALRQFYWYEETACSTNAPLVRIKGLSTACTPMMYPALWENVNQVLQFASAWRGRLEPDPMLLRFFGYVREHAKCFFPAALRLDSFKLPYIPVEDIHMVEISRDPTVGQEIYGAGHTVWAYMLFEAYVELERDDPEVLALCLDLQQSPSERSAARAFMLYNAGGETKYINGEFVNVPTHMSGWQAVQASYGGGNALPHGTTDALRLTLPPEQWIKIECSGKGDQYEK